MFARVFFYPGEKYKQHISDLSNLLKSTSLGHTSWALFEDYVASADIRDLEENFTSTFDMQPATCLELGWHLYGEAYERGEFLVKMRRQLAACEIKESVELPDHLSHVLQLIGTTNDAEIMTFTNELVIPSVEKILKSVPAENPFKPALETLFEFLSQNFNKEVEVK